MFKHHLLTLAPTLLTQTLQSSPPIKVPKGDPEFDPAGTGTKHLPFSRSKAGLIYGTDDTGSPVYEGEDRTGLPRDPINWVSPAIDGSMVYGTEAKVNGILREGIGGRIKMTAAGMPTQHEIGVPVDNPTGEAEETLMRAGDSRINDQPGIIAFHAIFLREHNRLADVYCKQDPDAPDELIFARARRMVVAALQSITYNEYLPALLGRKVFKKEEGEDNGDDNADGPGKEDAIVGKGTALSVPVEFSTAAFRFGHSQVSNVLWLRGANFSKISSSSGASSNPSEYRLKQSFFAPELLVKDGIDNLLRGAVVQRAERIDLVVADDLRNSLFGTVEGIRTIDAALSGDAIGGLDLVSLNLQRGRDHGIPDYVSVRKQLNLSLPTSYANITGGDDGDRVAANLEKVFGSFESNNLDLFVGGLAEPHRSGGSIGETFATIIERTFQSVRAADAGWYEAVLSDEERVFVEEEMTLAKLIRLNTKITEIGAAAFISPGVCASLRDNEFGCPQTTTITTSTITVTSTTSATATTTTSTTTTATTTTATTTTATTTTATTTTATTAPSTTETTSSATTTSNTNTGTATTTTTDASTTAATSTSATMTTSTSTLTMTTRTDTRTATSVTPATSTTMFPSPPTTAAAPIPSTAPSAEGTAARDCTAEAAAAVATAAAVAAAGSAPSAGSTASSSSAAAVAVVVGLLCSILGVVVGMAVGRPVWLEARVRNNRGSEEHDDGSSNQERNDRNTVHNAAFMQTPDLAVDDAGGGPEEVQGEGTGATDRYHSTLRDSDDGDGSDLDI